MENDVIKLLGCPFCGGSPDLVIHPSGEISSIVCKCCNLEMVHSSTRSILDMWNSRVYDSKQYHKWVVIPVYTISNHNLKM